MIKMITGTYGLMVGGAVEAMTKHSPPFQLSEEREAELVAAGVAVKVENPADRYADMKMTELRKLAAERGVDVSGARTKKAIIAILEAAEMLYPEDDKLVCGLLEED